MRLHKGCVLEVHLGTESPKRGIMVLHECKVCGYVYNPQKGDIEGKIPAGTDFEALPALWECPICASKKDMFVLHNEWS